MAHIGQRERRVALAKRQTRLTLMPRSGGIRRRCITTHLNGDYERALEFRRLHPDRTSDSRLHRIHSCLWPAPAARKRRLKLAQVAAEVRLDAESFELVHLEHAR